MIQTPDSRRMVLVCQHRSCRKQGSADVLAAFQASAVIDITVVGTGCLGECGNGPMVVVMPEQIWYSRVQPKDVSVLVEHHLQKGHPVVELLYFKHKQT